MKQVVVFELTLPWDRNVGNAHDYKINKYAALVNDLQDAGYVVDLYCFEVSVRGQISKANKARLKSLIHRYTDAGRLGFKKLVTSVSKASLLASFAIFCARDEGTWNQINDLSVQL